MNILVVSDFGLYSDFSSSFIHAQAKAYATLGHRVRVLILLPIGKCCNESRFFPACSMEKRDGVELCYLRFLSLSNFGKDWFNTKSALTALQCSFSRITEDFCTDVVHAHTLGLDSELGAYLKEKLGCPLVVTTHGSDTVAPYTSGDFLWIKRYSEKADRIFCVSTLLKNRLLESGVSVPISVVLNGFKLQNVLSGQKKQPISIIQVGSLIEQKKADITIQAFADLYTRHPDATLEIVGSGNELERLRLLCQQLKVEKAVHFSGFLSNPDALAKMAKAQFFCMPSVREGFGIVYLEAMASGCITIGTEGEGISDLIVNGQNGFLVPPDHPGAIVRIIEWCIANPKEADAIAERGRQDAKELAWEKNARKYIEQFNALIRND